MKFAGRKTFAELRKIKFPKSRFDMSHSHQGSYDWGYLYPIFYEEVSPGDYWQLAQQIVAKMMPTIAPLQHEINATTHYYFVPYRLLDDNWETFITGGPDGDDESSLPLWDPDATDKEVGSLWDHFGFPLTDCTGVEPIDYPKRAYNLVRNQYYMDENLEDEVDIETSHELLKRAWEKDYFTASLPWQQRGIAPALPISGTTAAVWAEAMFGASGAAGNIGVSPTVSDSKLYTSNDNAERLKNMKAFFGSNEVDFSDAATFDVSDLRAAFQIQRWMERNARAGVRYTEFIQAHFDESPRDDRLQRAEYIGGFRQQVTVTEVLQVSETSETPQGTRTGIGSVYGGGKVGNYKALEYGIIIGLLSIMPRSMYTQGVNRQWLRRTKYDFLFPEFANLSEQEVRKAELFAGATEETNLELFGYQGRYDELRQRVSRAVGLMRQSTSGLIHWNLSRKFATAPALNAAFIHVETQDLKDRVFAVPTEPGFIITLGNIATVERALPAIAEPGLIDHI